MTKRLARLVLAFGATLVLAGCATAPQTDAALLTPSPTPTVACPEMPGVELPPECAPYDPEHSMAQNDAYRERMDIDEADQASGQEIVPEVAAALGELRDAAE